MSTIRFQSCVSLITFLLFVSGLPSAHAQSPDTFTWEHVATYGEGFFAPDTFWLTVNEEEQTPPQTALVLDSQSDDQLLAMLHLDDARPVGRTITAGQGPGELSGNGLAASRFADGGVFVWDDGQRRAQVYTSELALVGTVNDPESVLASRTMLVNDTTLVTIVNTPGTEFMRLHRLQQRNGRGVVDPNPVRVVKTVDHALLDASPIVENTMLRQFQHARSGDMLFTVSLFSSHLIALRESGIAWASTAPADQPFPEYAFREGNTIYAPSVDEVPVGMLDVASDDSYVYALYSGEKVDSNMSPFSRSKIAAAIERIYHSDRLFIYDRNTGEWITEVTLPIRAKAIDVNNGYVGLLTDEAEEPTFEVYRMPTAWEE